MDVRGISLDLGNGYQLLSLWDSYVPGVRAGGTTAEQDRSLLPCETWNCECRAASRSSLMGGLTQRFCYSSPRRVHWQWPMGAVGYA